MAETNECSLNSPLQATLSSRPRADARKIADADLVERVRRRDASAASEFFDRYSGGVYAVALRILQDCGYAEDITQEILFQFWQNPEAFVQERGTLRSWLMAVARNRSIDLLRRRKHTDSPDDVVLASSFNLAAEAERHGMVDKIRQVLGQLPCEQQHSMELAFFEGLTHAEIAERTGLPLGTVKTRIRLALITLRRAFAV